MNSNEQINPPLNGKLAELLKDLKDYIAKDSTLQNDLTSPSFIDKLSNAIDRIQNLEVKAQAYFKLAYYVRDLGNKEQYKEFLKKFKEVEEEYVDYLEKTNHPEKAKQVMEALFTSFSTGSGATIQAVINKSHKKGEKTNSNIQHREAA